MPHLVGMESRAGYNPDPFGRWRRILPYRLSATVRKASTCLAALIVASCANAVELVANPDFAQGTRDWWATGNLAMTINTNGALCVEVPGGTAEPWDAIVGQNDISLVAGNTYRFAYEVSGTPEGSVRGVVQMPAEPWTAFGLATARATPGSRPADTVFAAAQTRADAQLVLQLGGSPHPWTACFSRVSIQADPDAKAHAANAAPQIRVNQVGYLPDGPKRATLVTDGDSALAWRLVDGSGREASRGMTEPKGFDPSAALAVHVIDFSGGTAVGSGFVLEVDGMRSHPFAIDSAIYREFAQDALSYFYPVRSGIAIDGRIAGEAYARPAGHVSSPRDGVANKGDRDVPCQAPESSLAAYGQAWTCSYSLDVTGGWYDAGDHGKYVVNGGISVAQLLHAYERTLHVEGADRNLLADGTLRIPERGNGLPDILDEARWQLDFMLKMMVPDGEELAGMVHHKIHDNQWTGLPLMPHRDDKVRELHRPSTAATLNLAAAAAQAARLFRTFDEAYSRTLLSAAVRAYSAAKRNPELLAPETDGNSGGGAYADSRVADEFYWAAAELFLTTGDGAYLKDLRASPYWNGEAFGETGFDWANVAALGRLSLATVPGGITARDREAVRRSIIDAADRSLRVQNAQPFGHPYAPANGRYDWGSNHLIVQNAIVMSRAYDFTRERKYRNGALESLDYLFGRNAIGISYVTGYGTDYARNQHSRWFARQLDPALPNPPRGSLAGGPNSSLNDPIAQRQLAGCAAQACYLDYIESWSTNEITINWNAALGQLAAFISEQ